jgi:hypothetical protein
MSKDAKLEISAFVFRFMTMLHNAALVDISFLQLTDGMLTISFEISGPGD